MTASFDLAGSLANYDLQESSIRRYLANKVQELALARQKAIGNVQAGDSGRGMLQSTSALNNYADTNLGYDQQVGDVNQTVNDQLMKIAQGRTDAQNQYQLYLQEQAKQNAANTQTFDPTDPYNWKGIDSAIKAGQIQAPASNPDPLNWAAIDAAIKSGQVKDPRPLMTRPAMSTVPKPVTTKPLVVKPAQSTKPKQGYY